MMHWGIVYGQIRIGGRERRDSLVRLRNNESSLRRDHHPRGRVVGTGSLDGREEALGDTCRSLDPWAIVPGSISVRRAILNPMTCSNRISQQYPDVRGRTHPSVHTCSRCSPSVVPCATWTAAEPGTRTLGDEEHLGRQHLQLTSRVPWSTKRSRGVVEELE